MFPKAAAEQLELPWLSGAQIDAVKAQAKKLGLLVGSVDAVTLLLVKRNPMDELRKRKTAQLMKLSAEKLRARANKAVGSGWAGSSLELSTASAAAKEDIKSEAIRVLIQVEETKHQSGSFYRFKKDGTADGYFDTGTWSEHPTRDITSLHHPLTALSDIFRAQQATEHAGQAAAAEPNGQAAHRAEAAQHQGAAGRRCVSFLPAGGALLRSHSYGRSLSHPGSAVGKRVGIGRPAGEKDEKKVREQMIWQILQKQAASVAPLFIDEQVRGASADTPLRFDLKIQ